MTEQRQRALGALYGLAIGDALGMPTQSLSRQVVVRRYGEIIDEFHPGPGDHPIAAGLPAGSVTDDTEQALLVADLLLESSGHIDGGELARRLLAWEERMRARGSLELLGPSTRRAVDELLAGSDLFETGRFGTTNGAAMRIAPVGIATPARDPAALLGRVLEASTVTHNTGTALAAATGVAAAISAGIEGAGVGEAIEAATAAAATAAHYGHFVAGADVASRLAWAVELVEGRSVSELFDLLDRLVGTSVAAQESVPAAFAVLAASNGDAWLAARLGASLGGDCDTIAAIAASMAGACQGVTSFPAESRRLVSDVNHLALEPVADGLLALRGEPAGAGLNVPPAGAAGLNAPPAGAAGRNAPPAGAAGRTAPPVSVSSGPSRQAAGLPSDPVLVHAGNAVVDLVLRVARLPERGGDVFASSADWEAGGGVNVMVAARRRGIVVRYAGALGRGPLGDIVRRALEANGIDALTAPRRQLDTGVVVTLVDPAGERTFVTRPGAEATLTEDDVAGVIFKPSDGLYVCHVAGFLVEAVDTTGAGDAHVGSFTAELLKGESALAAARLANAAAALAVLQEGPATAPTAGEVDRFLASRSTRA